MREQIEIFGPYLITESLDSAGPETVRAISLEEEAAEPVVLRRLPRWMWGDGYERDAFADELAVRERGVHSSVARVLDAGDVEGVPFVALESVPGISVDRALKKLAQRDEHLPEDVALFAVLSVADALIQLTSTGLDRTEATQVAPWPSTRRLILPFEDRWPVFLGVTVPPKAFPRKLSRERVLEAMCYEAPELRQGEPSNVEADVYALAVLLHELLEGRPPFPLDVGEIRRLAADGVKIELKRKGNARQLRPLRVLMEAALAPLPSERPSLYEVHETCRALLREVGRDRTVAEFTSARFVDALGAHERTTRRLKKLSERRSERAQRAPSTREVSVVIKLPRRFDGPVRTRDGREMVEVPGGVFLFGPELCEHELPAFFIDRFPTTNRDYLRFCEATGREPPAHLHAGLPDEWLDHPVVELNHDDALAFAEWAGKTLPTEPEWEKAARGDQGRLWPFGRRFKEELVSPGWQQPPWQRQTEPVDARSPDGDSPYGVAAIGQVWEWTENPAPDDGGWIVRGGAWRNRIQPPVVTNRSWEARAAADVGFRCVVSADGLEKIRE